MPLRTHHRKRYDRKIKIEHNGLYPYFKKYLDYRRTLGATATAIKGRDNALRRFIQFCDHREIHDPKDVTRQVIERYQRHLYYYRKSNGEPLSANSQQVLLSPLKSFFKWLTKNNYILYNPTSEMEMPRRVKRLPKVVLTVEEVEQIMRQPDVRTPEGIRDRAILEVLYATGIRRNECCDLKIYDIGHARQTMYVTAGKTGHDRYVPVGERALAWVGKYRRDIRPLLSLEPDSGDLFLADWGEQFEAGYLGALVKKYIDMAEINKVGSCQLFRHACATHMLEAGCDLYYIKEMLGHVNYNTTTIYARVSLNKMAEIHKATHPGSTFRKGLKEVEELLELLHVEDED